jgi:hypothetical protein
MAFQKGKSGNPKGRKKGTPDRRTSLRSLIEPSAPKLIAACIELGLSGDVSACRLLLDKVVPNVKPEMIPAPLNINLKGTATEQAQSILDAIAAGLIATDTGTALIRAIADAGTIKNNTEMFDRLLALEGMRK